MGSSKQCLQRWAEMGLRVCCCKMKEICRKEQKQRLLWSSLKEAIGPSKDFLTSSEAGHETIMWELNSCYLEQRNTLVSKAQRLERIRAGVLAKVSPLDRTVCPIRLPGTVQSSTHYSHMAYQSLFPQEVSQIMQSLSFVCFSLINLSIVIRP
jgi:hypothetical protein